jgi:hypothetical protein
MRIDADTCIFAEPMRHSVFGSSNITRSTAIDSMRDSGVENNMSYKSGISIMNRDTLRGSVESINNRLSDVEEQQAFENHKSGDSSESSKKRELIDRHEI